MRPANSAAGGYQPADPPSEPALLPRYLREEFTKIGAAVAALAAGHLDKTYAAPPKPRDGDVRYADGTQWKPNGTGGAGIWYFNGTTWIQLG